MATFDNDSADADCWNELMLGAQQGNRTALDLLFGEMLPWLFILVRSLKVNENDAWDIVQNTLPRLHSTLAKFDPALGDVRAWTGRIARNLVIDLRRRHLRRRSNPLPPDALSSNDAAGSNLEREEQLLLLRRALEVLKPNEREAILCRLEGLSYKRISEVLQTPVGTAGNRVHRAVNKLRRRLQNGD